jgi:NAD(P)H-dependent FMN reductase
MANTNTLIKKERQKKLIDLPKDTMKVLSLQAVSKGVSLKKYIEEILEEKVEETYEDLVLLQLSSTPEANEWLSEEETAEYVKKLRNEVRVWETVQ